MILIIIVSSRKGLCKWVFYKRLLVRVFFVAGFCQFSFHGCCNLLGCVSAFVSLGIHGFRVQGFRVQGLWALLFRVSGFACRSSGYNIRIYGRSPKFFLQSPSHPKTYTLRTESTNTPVEDLTMPLRRPRDNLQPQISSSRWFRVYGLGLRIPRESNIPSLRNMP